MSEDKERHIYEDIISPGKGREKEPRKQDLLRYNTPLSS